MKKALLLLLVASGSVAMAQITALSEDFEGGYYRIFGGRKLLLLMVAGWLVMQTFNPVLHGRLKNIPS